MLLFNSIIFYSFAFNSIPQLGMPQHVTMSVLNAVRSTEQSTQLIPTFEGVLTSLVRSGTNT